MSCSCHICAPCGYCTSDDKQEYAKQQEKEFGEFLREHAVTTDNVHSLESWKRMGDNRQKCPYYTGWWNRAPWEEGGCTC